ncbi:MAG: HDOD domain-containing protein, partial [Pseudomonadota bacterium]|nr:HDOD domain-containing protein [Pseudomonadota bacterium]
MALVRWWHLFKRRPSPASSGFADAAVPLPLAEAALAPAPSSPRPAAATLPPPTPFAPAAAPAAAVAVVDEPLADAERVRFFSWLVAAPATEGGAASPELVVQHLMERLDEVIASETLRSGLLPRAPHVIPQLMKTLRDERYSSVDVASRISKDVVLTAEVVRSATSALQRGDDEGEIDLARAVTMIGTQGLRRAIASVVLRPIFDARGDTFSARAAAQIWQDADRKARLGAVLAAQQALDPFDGYLAGLLHNTGWTALLRAIDGFEDIGLGGVQLAHPDVVPQLLQRRDALFGALVGPWNLSASLDQVAAEVASRGLEGVESTLGRA